jgi:phenylacetate-CoA ligase
MIFSALETWWLMSKGLASSFSSVEAIRRGQLEKLKRLLQHACVNVPLYSRLYHEAGFHPQMLQSLEDLERIPILTKTRLLEARPEERVACGVALENCEIVRTSGSTGRPLAVYLGPKEVCWQRAVAWRVLFEHGFRWTDRTLEIRMNPGRSYAVQKLGIAPKDWLSILESPRSWAEHLADGKHQVVVAGASTLHALAEAAETAGLCIKPPRIVVSDSELLSASTRSLIRRVLGTDPIDVFGLVEVSNFAWECEQREGFHISADSHIVEVMAPSSRPGPMLVTALGMWTMPFIRYATGDIAALDSRPCRCGRYLPKLLQLDGREWDAIILPDGKKLYAPCFHEILAKFSELRRWQLIQDTALSLSLKLVMRQDIPQLFDLIRRSLRSALPPEMELHIQEVDDIHTPVGQKPKAIVSNLHAGGSAT